MQSKLVPQQAKDNFTILLTACKEFFSGKALGSQGRLVVYYRPISGV
jgi:hypothetical protein